MTIRDPISLTARWIAAARATETRRADRLFSDPFAEALSGPEGFALLEKMAQMGRTPSPPGTPPESPYLVIRTRFIDEFLESAVRDRADAQVVVLAAGLDARAFRLTLPAGTHVFELDRPEVIAYKEQALAQAGAKPVCRRTTIPLDLTRPFGAALRAGGFDPSKPSVWLVEGLLPYLDEPEARGVLEQCAELAAPGSTLVADLPGLSFLRSSFVRPLIDALIAMNAPWRFGSDTPEAFFRAFGWHATARRPGDAGASFGRWPHPVAPRGTRGVPETFLVTATRA